jgi:hypothetical protein
MQITCGCGHAFGAWIWQSANVAAAPELRETILRGEMNVVKCPSCGARFHVEIPFLYNDVKRAEWIWVYPAAHGENPEAARAQVEEMWERISAEMPSGIKRAIETNYKTMLLFGMDALVAYLKSEDASRDADRSPST